MISIISSKKRKVKQLNINLSFVVILKLPLRSRTFILDIKYNQLYFIFFKSIFIF